MHTSEYVFGFHAIEGLLTKDAHQVHRLMVQTGRQDKRIQALLKKAKAQGVKVVTVPQHELDGLLPDAAHQGVIACCGGHIERIAQTLEELLDSLDKPAFLLVLDGVQDPHNLGACLRSAAAAKVDAVIIPRDNAVGITPTVRKVACGGAEIVPLIQVTNLARSLRLMQERGIWLFGAAEQAEESVYHADLTGPIAFVLGGEEKGIRDLTRKQCDYLIAIPTAGELKSLNVSVAAGICLFEAVRQRHWGR